jgi:hypothetical protein
MKDKAISRNVANLILMIFLLNALMSIANLIQDGAILRRVIPAVGWSIASLIWIALSTGRIRREN